MLIKFFNILDILHAIRQIFGSYYNDKYVYVQFFSSLLKLHCKFLWQSWIITIIFLVHISDTCVSNEAIARANLLEVPSHFSLVNKHVSPCYRASCLIKIACSSFWLPKPPDTIRGKTQQLGQPEEIYCLANCDHIHVKRRNINYNVKHNITCSAADTSLNQHSKSFASISPSSVLTCLRWTMSALFPTIAKGMVASGSATASVSLAFLTKLKDPLSVIE